MDGTLALSEQARRVDGLAEASLYSAAVGRDGNVYVGTGDGGKILKVPQNGPAEVFATLPEKEVTSVAFGPDGALYAGTGPGAKVYRIEKGKPALYYEPRAQYVWALAFSAKDLYVGTGLPGEIHRVTAAGKGERIHATPDAHVRALYADAQGRIWAGTSGSGLVLRIEKSGRVTTVYDSAKTEITALAATADGRMWAAAGSADIASSGAEPISSPSQAPSTHASNTARDAEPGAKDRPEVTVTVSAPRLASSRPSGQKGGYSSEVVLFEDGEPPHGVWSSSEEIVFALSADPGKPGVLAATGPNGKLYRVASGQWSLERTFDEKQVTFLAGNAVGTNSASGVYRLSTGARSGEFVSAVKDTGRTSRFGAFRWEGDSPIGTSVEFSFRSGESSVPDSTWSAWSDFAPASRVATVSAPPARFLQWRLRMESDGGKLPLVRRVETSYRNRNTAPSIDSFLALGPAEVFARSASGGSNVFETMAPDEKGIFTSLEEPKSESPPRKLLRKGYRTVTWKATDADGDALTYELEFRPSPGDGRWMPLKKGLRETFYSFDTTSLPDGDYVFRVTASDGEANPDEKKTASRETPAVTVDNTPPVIRKTAGSPGVFEFEAVDAASPILEAEYSVDAKEWVRVEPKDGLSDSPRELYAIRLDPKLSSGFLLVRVTDSARNTAAASFTIP
jgi:hypothetical protein